MTVDRTLRISGGLLRTRSVLSRAERVTQLKDEGKFNPEADSPFGLPKVKVRRSKVGTKTKKAAEEPAAAAGAEQAAAEPGAEKKPEGRGPGTKG